MSAFRNHAVVSLAFAVTAPMLAQAAALSGCAEQEIEGFASVAPTTTSTTTSTTTGTCPPRDASGPSGGQSPQQLVADAKTASFLTLDESSLYWLDLDDGSVHKAAKDGSWPNVIETVPCAAVVNAGPMVQDADYLYVTADGCGAVHKIPKDDTPSTVLSMPSGPVFMTASSSELFVARIDEGKVYRMSKTTGEQTLVWSVSESAQAIAGMVEHAGELFLSMSGGTSSVLRLNPATATTTTVVPGEGVGASIGFGNDRLFYANPQLLHGAVFGVGVDGSSPSLLSGATYPSRIVSDGTTVFWYEKTGHRVVEIGVGPTEEKVASLLEETLLSVAVDSSGLYLSLPTGIYKAVR